MVSATSDQRQGGSGGLSEATQSRIALIRAERRACDKARVTPKVPRATFPNSISFVPVTDPTLGSIRRRAAAEALALVGLLIFLTALAALYVIAPLPVATAV